MSTGSRSSAREVRALAASCKGWCVGSIPTSSSEGVSGRRMGRRLRTGPLTYGPKVHKVAQLLGKKQAVGSIPTWASIRRGLGVLSKAHFGDNVRVV